MIEIFKNPNYDFLGKAKFFIAFSVILSIAGIISMVTRGFNLGVDFAGGSKATVRFKSDPSEDRVRGALEKVGIAGDKITLQRSGQRIGQGAPRFEMILTVPDIPKDKIIEALEKHYPQAAAPAGLTNLNNGGAREIASILFEKDPLSFKTNLPPGDAEKEYNRFAESVIRYRTAAPAGLITDLNQIPVDGFDAKFREALPKFFYAGEFSLIGFENVGPQVGQDLQRRAILVTLISCLGMLVFIAFRFEWIYGVAAIVATLHDVIVTLGMFSLFQWEISLTFIAAILTLIGYSMNDTIVIFDRIRETLKIRRREDLTKVTNDAINQTLSRTIIASGLTFLSVVALLLFGGEVLKSFSLVLVIGILIGTYSSIAVASPIMIWWKRREEAQRQQQETEKKTSKKKGASESNPAKLESKTTAKSAPAAR